MAAAAITPSVVQKTYVPSIGKDGTPVRLVRYFFQLTKVTDADWIVTATHFQAGAPLYWNACTVDTNGVQESTVGMAYTASGTKLTLSGGTTGLTSGEVWYAE